MYQHPSEVRLEKIDRVAACGEKRVRYQPAAFLLPVLPLDALAALFDAYPDAKLLWIHRDPVQATASRIVLGCELDEGVMGSVEWPFGPDTETAMRDYRRNNRGDRYGKFTYSTDIIGEDIEALQREFEPYRKRFNLDIEKKRA